MKEYKAHDEPKDNVPVLVAWDIETTPWSARGYGVWDVNVAHSNIDKFSDLASVSFLYMTGPKAGQHFNYSVWDQGYTLSAKRKAYKTMLKAIWEMRDEADGLVSWNGRRFDTKQMNKFFILAGMTEPSEHKEIDLMAAVKNKAAFEHNSLNAVSQRLLGDHKTEHYGIMEMVERMENTKVYLKYFPGKTVDDIRREALQLFLTYNEQDTRLTAKLYYRLLPWLPKSMILNQNLYSDFFEDMVCPACGSTDYIKKGVRRTTTGARQRYKCNDCGRWFMEGPALKLTTTGVL